jgi:hypothetical protein
VDRRWLRRCVVRRARSPKAAEAEDEPLARKSARRSFEFLDCPPGSSFEFEGDAFDDEARCAACRGGVEEVRSTFTARAAVRSGRWLGQVGDEVDDRLWSRMLREVEKRFGVVDVTEGGFGAELAKELQLLRRSRQRHHVVLVEVRQRGAAEDAACSCEEDSHR